MRATSKVAWITEAPESTLYEETIPINFKVVGSREWLNGWIAPNAIPKDRVVRVSYPGDLAPIKEDFENSPVHGFDTEGGGKNPGDGLDPLSPNSMTILAQYGTPNMIYLMEPKLLLEFKPWLQSEKHLLLGQNLKYDFEFILSKYGFPLVNMYDTMLAEQMLTAGKLGVNVGLSDLMRKYPPHYITNKSIRSQFINFKLGNNICLGLIDRRRAKYAGNAETSTTSNKSSIKLSDSLKFPPQLWLTIAICLLFYGFFFPFISVGKLFLIKRFDLSPPKPVKRFPSSI